jgi:hypothetical protein
MKLKQIRRNEKKEKVVSFPSFSFFILQNPHHLVEVNECIISIKSKQQQQRLKSNGIGSNLFMYLYFAAALFNSCEIFFFFTFSKK